MLVPTIAKISPVTMTVVTQLMSWIVAIVRFVIRISTTPVSRPANKHFGGQGGLTEYLDIGVLE